MPILQRLVGSRLTEALGYAGGALIVIAAILLGGSYWEELGVPGRLAVLGGLAALLGIAGWFAADSSAPLKRLRSVLWVLSLLALGGSVAIVGTSVLQWRPASVVVLTGLLGAAYALPLWLRTRSALQLCGLFGALAVSVGGLAAQLPFEKDAHIAVAVGSAIWLLSAGWTGLGLRELLRPPRVAVAVGSFGLLVACQLVMAVPWGHIIAIATVVVLLGVAAFLGDTILMVAGTVGLIITGPLTVARFFDQNVGIPLSLLALGLLLVGVGLISAQRRRNEELPRPAVQHRHLFGHH